MPTLVEVKTAIKLMKNGKSAGIDGVMEEALKAGGETVIQRLHLLLQLVWHSEKKKKSHCMEVCNYCPN